MSWIIFLSIIGIVLICVELFIPGMVVGTMGVICLVVAVILTYALYGMTAGHIALSALLISSGVGVFLWITFFPKTRGGRLLITSRDLADSKSADSLEKLLGKVGRSLTPLRPAGTAQVENQRVDVVAESGLIDADHSIRVVKVEGNRVVVRKI